MQAAIILSPGLNRGRDIAIPLDATLSTPSAYADGNDIPDGATLNHLEADNLMSHPENLTDPRTGGKSLFGSLASLAIA